MDFGLLDREARRKIPLPDPKVQKFRGRKIPVCEPTLGENEKRYVLNCLKKNWISSHGEYVVQFEKKFARLVGAKHGISCSSGTAALHMALASLRLKPGDEVILPAFTMIATVNAVSFVGAKPVLVDCDPHTWNMNVDAAAKKITKKTKGILPVHIYGHPCDMDPLLALAKRRRLFVLEDAAEAHGALYKGRIVGCMGDLGAFSFFANKIVMTGEGGMVVTNNGKLADYCRSFRNYAFSKDIHFWHRFIGYNYRFTNLHAAIGLGQLEKLPKLVAARRDHARLYMKYLRKIPGITLPFESANVKNVYWMFGILVDKPYPLNRDQLRKRLARYGIETRSFFIPIHWQKPYQKMFLGEKYPVAEELCAKGFYLPSSSSLTDAQIRFICDCIAHAKD